MADLKVTRKDLEEFLPNLRTVRAFENLLNTPSSTEGLQTQIDAINNEIAEINVEIVALNQAITDATNYGTY